MSPTPAAAARSVRSVPRVSGDEPITAIFAKKDWGFPRMSGDEPFL